MNRYILNKTSRFIMSDITLKWLEYWNAVMQNKISQQTGDHLRQIPLPQGDNLYHQQRFAFEDLRRNLIVMETQIMQKYRKEFMCIVLDPKDINLFRPFPDSYKTNAKNVIYKTAAWLSRWLTIAKHRETNVSDLQNRFHYSQFRFFMEPFFILDNQTEAIKYIEDHLITKPLQHEYQYIHSHHKLHYPTMTLKDAQKKRSEDRDQKFRDVFPQAGGLYIAKNSLHSGREQGHFSLTM